jgi:hypothetical protein
LFCRPPSSAAGSPRRRLGQHRAEKLAGIVRGALTMSSGDIDKGVGALPSLHSDGPQFEDFAVPCGLNDVAATERPTGG